MEANRRHLLARSTEKMYLSESSSQIERENTRKTHFFMKGGDQVTSGAGCPGLSDRTGDVKRGQLGRVDYGIHACFGDTRWGTRSFASFAVFGP